MSGRFTDRTVLVTGASRGLGRAIALAFGRERARVLLGFRVREAEATATAEAVVAAGGSAGLLGFDVTRADAIDEAIAKVGASGIDILVNNAGLVADGAFPMVATADWDEVVAVNLRGAFLLSRAVARGMIARRRGAIVNVASVAALRASPGQAAYAAAKGGLLALTRTLAAELAPRGVRVNAVVPGLLGEGMGARVDRRAVERTERSIPLGRVGTAAETAAAVLFLASDEAAYVIGQALAVDGGLSL